MSSVRLKDRIGHGFKTATTCCWTLFLGLCAFIAWLAVLAIVLPIGTVGIFAGGVLTALRQVLAVVECLLVLLDGVLAEIDGYLETLGKKLRRSRKEDSPTKEGRGQGRLYPFALGMAITGFAALVLKERGSLSHQVFLVAFWVYAGTAVLMLLSLLLNLLVDEAKYQYLGGSRFIRWMTTLNSLSLILTMGGLCVNLVKAISSVYPSNTTAVLPPSGYHFEADLVLLTGFAWVLLLIVVAIIDLVGEKHLWTLILVSGGSGVGLLALRLLGLSFLRLPLVSLGLLCLGFAVFICFSGRRLSRKIAGSGLGSYPPSH